MLGKSLLSLFQEQLRGQRGWSRVNEGRRQKGDVCCRYAGARDAGPAFYSKWSGEPERGAPWFGLHFEYISSVWGTSTISVDKKMVFLWPISYTANSVPKGKSHPMCLNLIQDFSAKLSGLTGTLWPVARFFPIFMAKLMFKMENRKMNFNFNFKILFQNK